MVNDIVYKSIVSSKKFNNYSQKEVDKVVEEVFKVGIENATILAKMAAEETGIGRWEDKVTKNILATKYIYEDIKNLKTVGIINSNDEAGIIEVAQPLGPIFAVVPATNPTSTVMFKILIALKTRNPIIISFPAIAQDVCSYTAKLLYETAIKAGAPNDCIQWVRDPNREKTKKFMSHKDIALILATGSNSLVEAAYSSGTPALGVGSGNVPVLIEDSYDIDTAIDKIMISKTFDNGTICASEQSIVIEKKNMSKVIKALKRNLAYLVPLDEVPILEKIVYDKSRQRVYSDIVGKTANFISKKAKLKNFSTTSLLVVKQNQIGEKHPFSSEILAPIISLYEAEDFHEAVDICSKINEHGGKGHTASIFSNKENKIMEYSSKMNVSRVIVNTPSAQGAVGGIYNNLKPSLTLGCGTHGHNSTTDNISARHLLNIQRIAKPIV